MINLKKIFIFSFFVLALLLSGCMKLFNLSLESGVYVAGEWNNWVPMQNDRMVLNNGIYEFEIPVASITFYPGSLGNIGWYKVIYVGGVTKVQSSVPVWKENLADATSITVFASPNIMRDGYAVGAGDIEKEIGDWYCAGDFNGWSLEKMEKIDGKFVYELNIDVNKGDSFKYKIARGIDWKPYEEQFDGKNYNAGYGQDALFIADKSGSSLYIEFDPKFSILNVYVK
ncbi:MULTISPECIES: hypothetical protein [unclassified Thermosipho (in: thermotogales)]|uniref:hypothetical protein n=1 Tax=unclassified Thermosipho (in: thermotogales) TaxID=2676525 RepID=UPI0009FA2D79|nr:MULTISPECIES: hypothetical protein [unclassified Thermosipho (in: thermotogales)]